MGGYDSGTIFPVIIIAVLVTAVLVLPYVVIRVVIRLLNRRDDPRHAKRPRGDP